MEFLHVDILETAREKLLDITKDWILKSDIKTLEELLGKVISEDFFAQDNVPHFRRSTVDGYAVVSKDTAAAGERIPGFLTVKCQVDMGQSALFSIKSGECVEVFTGGMIPDGADSVVMVEYTESFALNEIAVYNTVSYGENVVQVGEDVQSGDLLLKRGKRILPQDIGILAAAGVTEVQVYAPVKMTIVSTGDELVPPDKAPNLGQIRDVNTNALAALAGKSGFDVIKTMVLPDDKEVLEQAVQTAMKDSDIVIVSGGSSKGKKDLTNEVFSSLSKPGVFIHGLAIKPGKPTILGYDDSSKTLLLGLPGHPVAAMIVFELLLCWLLRKLTGSPEPPFIPAKLSCNVASPPGRQSYWPVRLVWSDDGYIAEPIYGKSGLISILSKADGYFMVERDLEGLTAGQTVFVHLFHK